MIGINMCTGTMIKHVYWGVQGACLWQAVTSAEGTAERQRVPCRRHGSKACYLSFTTSLPADENHLPLVLCSGSTSRHPLDSHPPYLRPWKLLSWMSFLVIVGIFCFQQYVDVKTPFVPFA